MEIQFLSSNEFYWKEKYGIKNNTVRIISKNHDFEGLKYHKYKYIKIINENDENEFFIKLIKDVSFYKNLCIITWWCLNDNY